MNRSTLLSVCAAVSLLACTGRPSTGATGDAAGPPPPPTEAQAPVVVPPPPGGSTVEDAGAPDPGALAGIEDAGSARCSAAGVKLLPARTGPPPPPKAVEDMRRRIITAAMACDYAQLAKLADEKGKGVRFTFGEGSDAAAYWKQQEAKGEPVLARIVQVLDLPYATEGDLYYWPWVHVDGLKSEGDVKALVGIYPESQLQAMRKAGGSYYGLRVGIAKNGDWQLAVAGD